jgi:hypothetical protein
MISTSLDIRVAIQNIRYVGGATAFISKETTEAIVQIGNTVLVKLPVGTVYDLKEKDYKKPVLTIMEDEESYKEIVQRFDSLLRTCDTDSKVLFTSILFRAPDGSNIILGKADDGSMTGMDERFKTIADKLAEKELPLAKEGSPIIYKDWEDQIQIIAAPCIMEMSEDFITSYDLLKSTNFEV